MMNRLRHAFGDHRDGHIARRHHGVERVGRNAETEDLLTDRAARTRCIGDEHHGAAPAPERDQRVGGGSKGFPAVVDHAPDIAEDRVIAVGDFAEPRDA